MTGSLSCYGLDAWMRLECAGAVDFRNIVRTQVLYFDSRKNLQAAAMRARRKDFAQVIEGYEQTQTNGLFRCEKASIARWRIGQNGDETFANFQKRCADDCNTRTSFPDACHAFVVSTVTTELQPDLYCDLYVDCDDQETLPTGQALNIYRKTQDSPNGRFWNALMWCWICV